MIRKFRRVWVKIARSMMDIPSKCVFEHELPLLQAIHGEGSVEVLEKPPVGIEPEAWQEFEVLHVDDEWDRLANVYGNHPDSPVVLVEWVFQNDRRKLAKYGVDPEEAVEAVKGNNEDGDEALRVEDIPSSTVTTADLGNREVLQDYLRRLGVQFHHNNSVETLRQKLEDGIVDYLGEHGLEHNPDASLENLVAQFDAIADDPADHGERAAG